MTRTDNLVFPGATGQPLPGIYKSYTTVGTAIPVGSEFKLAFPSGYWTRIVSGKVGLDIAQAQTNVRYVGYHMSDGNVFVYGANSDVGMASGDGIPSIVAGFAVNVSSNTDNAHNLITIPIVDMWLPPGSYFQTNTFGFNGLDHYTAVILACYHIDANRYQQHYGRHWDSEWQTSHIQAPAFRA